MRNVRIEPCGSAYLYVGIECECLRIEKMSTVTELEADKHIVEIGGRDVSLRCACGAVYILHPENNHVHVMRGVYATPGFIDKTYPTARHRQKAPIDVL